MAIGEGGVGVCGCVCHSRTRSDLTASNGQEKIINKKQQT